MRVSFRRIDSRETIQPWRGGKPETAENDAATLAAAARVEQMQLHGYSATEQQSQLLCHITEHGCVIFLQIRNGSNLLLIILIMDQGLLVEK